MSIKESWPVNALPDAELEELNGLLPWAAFMHDAHGRNLGKAFSEKKRNSPHSIPDSRILQFDQRFGLAGRSILEVGCFEGLHTTALCQRADKVVAIDGRVENVVKTLARCAMLGHFPEAYHWNLEETCPDFLKPRIEETDFLLHIGVLYHLGDPAGHMAEIAEYIGKAILLDTHIAGPDDETEAYEALGETWNVWNYREGPRANPFAGLVPTARWLTETDLVRLLKHLGFETVEITSKREERNGWRVTLFASR